MMDNLEEALQFTLGVILVFGAIGAAIFLNLIIGVCWSPYLLILSIPCSLFCMCFSIIQGTDLLCAWLT